MPALETGLSHNGSMTVPADTTALGRITAFLECQADLQLALVFGSVARGQASATSDLDIAVLSDVPLDAGRIMALMEQLAQISGRPVDLVDLRTAGLPVVRSALFGGKKLLCRSNSAYALLLSRTLVDSADFLPYRERLLKQRRDAWIR